ncbi:protein NUCLEAR FUSION DEFECTIVE 4-like [Salvia divinorum]|uniref:Protein NUCLEAR FUSION DEFECTIVE 4-like n=1 Tax=Salvia divinorum TaxID=28513 RepID=A0ABD1FIV7_SALDI
MEPDYNPSRKTLIKNKWVAAAASIWIQCTAGSLYTFSIYSQVLKSTQSYDQSTLSTISWFKDVGANVGLLSGLLYSATASRCGPWVVLLAGALQCFAGYFLMWLSVTGALPRPAPAVMCLYMLVAAHAMTFFNTANVVTGVHNFPSYSGTIVGIMKGFLGLSGAILILVYQTIFKHDPSSYILLLALLPPINTVLFMGFVRIFRTSEEDEIKHLNAFSSFALVLAAYLATVIIIQNILKLTVSIRALTFSLLVMLLLSPVCIAIRAQRYKSYRMVKSLLEHNQMSDDNDPIDDDDTDTMQDQDEYHEILNGADQVRESNNNSTLHLRDDVNIIGAMRTISFWLLFFTTACSMGSGLALVNNMSQIGESLSYKSFEVNTLVSLWSIWNFLGRFGAGYISDYFLRAKRCPRPLFMIFTLATMSIGYAMIAFGFPGALYAGSVLVGVCYGSQWSLMPTIASELFGKEHLGTIFNTITSAGPIGSYILSIWVVGFLYDKEVIGDGNTCIGIQCFRFSFLIMAAVALSGSLVALVLFFWTRKFYKHVVLRRLFHSLRESKRIDYDD